MRVTECLSSKSLEVVEETRKQTIILNCVWEEGTRTCTLAREADNEQVNTELPCPTR